MKKSGKTNRAEPCDLSWVKNFPQCAQLFSDARWLTFFKKIEGYHAQVFYRFAQCLDTDIVSLTLKFKLTKELIAVDSLGRPRFYYYIYVNNNPSSLALWETDHKTS